jgi:hypothetical protein
MRWTSPTIARASSQAPEDMKTGRDVHDTPVLRNHVRERCKRARVAVYMWVCMCMCVCMWVCARARLPTPRRCGDVVVLVVSGEVTRWWAYLPSYRDPSLGEQDKQGVRVNSLPMQMTALIH